MIWNKARCHRVTLNGRNCITQGSRAVFSPSSLKSALSPPTHTEMTRLCTVQLARKERIKKKKSRKGERKKKKSVCVCGGGGGGGGGGSFDKRRQLLRVFSSRDQSHQYVLKLGTAQKASLQIYCKKI